MWMPHDTAIERARLTRIHARALRQAAVAARVRAVELSHLSAIRGSSDDGMARVGAAINESWLCWRCIATKCGLTAPRLDELVVELRRTVAVAVALASCEGCQRDTLVYRLA